MNNHKVANYYMLFLIFIQYSLSYILGFLFYNIENLDFFAFQTISQIIIFIVPIVIYLLLTKQNIVEVLKIKPLSLKNIFFVIVLCLTIMPIMLILASITTLFFKNTVSDFVLENIVKYPLFATIGVVALTPSICEEVAFRGFIYKNYENFDIKKAAIINGLFFGLMHLNLSQFFYAFFLGILFAYFVYYTSSILSSVIGHFFINGTQTLNAYYAMKFQLEDSDTLAQLEQQTELTKEFIVPLIITIIIIFSAFFSLFIFIFKKFVKYNRNNTHNLPQAFDLNPPKLINVSFVIVIIIYIIAVIRSTTFA